jgi:hypothetical protein
MGLDDVPRCQHVKTNGTQCGSPALRRRRHCYFHDRVRRERAKIAANTLVLRRFDLPLLEDANSVQMALMKVIQMLGSGQLDHKTAGLMLYALQTASINLRNTEFEAEVTDVVIDPDTVHATCINGPQWFEDDFADDGDETEQETAEEAEVETADDGEEAPTSVQASANNSPQSAKETNAKLLTVEETRKQVQGIARNWLLEQVAQKPQ